MSARTRAMDGLWGAWDRLLRLHHHTTHRKPAKWPHSSGAVTTRGARNA